MASVVMSCVKYLVFFFNLIFAIAGVVTIVVGSLLQNVYSTYSNFVNENFNFLPILIIVVGVVIFIIAFFGCCGAVTENHCMITTFASLLMIIFIMEVVAAIGGYIFLNDLNNAVRDRMESSLKYYSTDDEVKRSWDILQSDLHCCGVNGTSDWLKHIPRSCCLELPQYEECTVKDSFEKGCFDLIYTFIENNAVLMISIAAGVALIQVVGIAFGCCLAFCIRKGYETV